MWNAPKIQFNKLPAGVLRIASGFNRIAYRDMAKIGSLFFQPSTGRLEGWDPYLPMPERFGTGWLQVQLSDRAKRMGASWRGQ